jgi:hypothetical protein
MRPEINLMRNSFIEGITDGPLVKKVPVGVNYIWLAKFTLDERHDLW